MNRTSKNGAKPKSVFRWGKYLVLFALIGLIAARAYEQDRLEEITQEILDNKNLLAQQIIELCQQPEIATTEAVYPAPSNYTYQLRCDTFNMFSGAKERDYYIWFRRPYGKFAFPRLWGVSDQDYIDASGWVLDPQIARLTEKGQVIWLDLQRFFVAGGGLSAGLGSHRKFGTYVPRQKSIRHLLLVVKGVRLTG